MSPDEPSTSTGGTPPVKQSPYAVLGVRQDATRVEVGRAHQEALRARTHSREQVTRAFDRLRDPGRRLAADLLEPPPEPATDDVATPGPFVDAASAPLPDWTVLVAPGSAVVVPREIDAPSGEVGGPPPSGAVVPPPEFPV